MYYIAHYTNDAYYEPAEGGYYVETSHLDHYDAFKSMKAARKWLKRVAKAIGYMPAGYSYKHMLKHAKEVDKNGNIIKQGIKRVNKYADEEYFESKYVGDGAFLVMERGWKAHAKGYQPYC